MGNLVVPLKAAMPFWAQAANHPLPGDLTYADGSTLSVGAHGIDSGSSPYTLPDFRNVFLVGANRTGVLNDGGQYINFIVNTSASGNSYTYQIIDHPMPTYTVGSGDYLYYDIYLPSGSIPAASPNVGVELTATDASVFRSAGVNDQNGIALFGDIRPYATDQWYTRQFSLSSWVGKTISKWDLVNEYDSTFSSFTVRYQNLRIVNGIITKFWAWQSGDGTPTYTTDYATSNTFVSGNASTLGAPGPNGITGSHQRRMRTRNIPAHNHTASSDSQGFHSHSTSISAHGSHSHNPNSGGNFAYGAGSTYARAGGTYRNVTCTASVSGGGGNHAHSVSPPNDGAHGHNITVSTASSGGVNASSTAFDPRPRYTAVVWCLKSGTPAKRALSIPMGTIIMWYADAANETLPGGMSYCDGSSLTSGNHSVPNQSGSMAYTLVLPDLRNQYLIGADRTKAFGAAGTTSDGYDGAPGPGYQAGTHTASITIANFPDHGHSASTDTQWTTHNHNWSIGANGDHSHSGAANYPLSSQGATEIQGSGGSPFDEYKATLTAETLTSLNDAHNHTFFIGTAGAHSHNITVNANGSGGTWDNRSPFIGIVFLMKTNVGLTSVPLKTVVSFRATSSGEALVPTDGTWAACDGTTLTPGQFDMAANSGGNYVLPDFRKFYALGADRTKAALNAGDQTNSAAGAPGPKGTAGSDTISVTTTIMPSHIHSASADTQGNHAHGGSVATSSDGGHRHATGCHTYWCTTDGVLHNAGTGSFTSRPVSVDTYSTVLAFVTQPGHGTSGDGQGGHSHAITINNAGAGSPMHQRPRSHGVVFYMKVKR